jgi:chromosome segregation ATPase
MAKLKPVMVVLAVAGVAAWGLGPGTIRREASKVLRAAWQEGSHWLVEHDLARLAALIESKSAALDRVRQKQQELKECLSRTQEARSALARRLENDRDILSQISQILRRQRTATVSFDGSAYERTTVESDEKWYLDRCKSAESELRNLVAIVAELEAGVARVDTAVTIAETRLAHQQAAYHRLAAQDESRRLREEINGLVADAPVDSVEVLAEEIGTLLQPLADRPSRDDGRSQAPADRHQVALEVDSYLEALLDAARPR